MKTFPGSITPMLCLLLALAASGAVARGLPECAGLAQTRGVYQGVPYLRVAPGRPAYTIIYVHGGPHAPTFGDTAVATWACRLAISYRAAVIVPVYFGSAERMPRQQLRFEVRAASSAEARRQVLRHIERDLAGMPVAVHEVRAFMLANNRPSTVVVGASFGALLSTVARPPDFRGRLVLVAPALATFGEMFDSNLAGVPSGAIKGALELGGPSADSVRKLFAAPDDWRMLDRTAALAYFKPYENAELGAVIARSRQRTAVIVGLKDRVGMIRGDEWRRFQRTSKGYAELCLDPGLGHEIPMIGVGRRCLDRWLTPRDRPAGVARQPG